MNGGLSAVLGSVVEVFGLVAASWAYARRFRPDLGGMLRLGMHIFVPCLTFVAIVDARLELGDLRDVTAASVIQIAAGLVLGWVGLRIAGWGRRRELLLPVAFVNSAYLAFPLLVANWGGEGLSRGVLYNTITTVLVFSVGVMVLRGGGRMTGALREPAFWAVAAAGLLRLFRIPVPEIALRVPRLAGAAAVPVMLVIFGAALARTRLASVKEALYGTFLRYATGAAGLALTLWLLHPHGVLRKVLILYALLPPAVINVALTEEAGRDAEAVASVVLIGTLVSLVILPFLLVWLG